MEEYLKNLLKENKIDVKSQIGGDDKDANAKLTYKIVIDYILSLAPKEQDYIRQHMIVLDFEDGDIVAYFKQLAGVMVQSKGN
jgi:hypothetical protein